MGYIAMVVFSYFTKVFKWLCFWPTTENKSDCLPSVAYSISNNFHMYERKLEWETWEDNPHWVLSFPYRDSRMFL